MSQTAEPARPAEAEASGATALDSIDAIRDQFRPRDYVRDRPPAKADQPPRVILTSNRTREVHDALKRRCLYHWIDYPTAQKEFEIVLARVPDAPERLAREVVAFVHRLREADLTKVPGIAETLDWAAALLSLGSRELTGEVVDETLGVVLKYEEDIRRSRGEPARGYLAEAGGPP